MKIKIRAAVEEKKLMIYIFYCCRIPSEYKSQNGGKKSTFFSFAGMNVIRSVNWNAVNKLLSFMIQCTMKEVEYRIYHCCRFTNFGNTFQFTAYATVMYICRRSVELIQNEQPYRKRVSRLINILSGEIKYCRFPYLRIWCVIYLNKRSHARKKN